MKAYAGCHFCNGRGCLACDGEFKKEQKRLAARQAANPAPVFKPRFDGEIYRDCPHCQGEGCARCPEEADAEYNRQFPGGPKPMASFTFANPAHLEGLKSVLGIKSLEHAFGPDGNGVDEIQAKCYQAKLEGRAE